MPPAEKKPRSLKLRLSICWWCWDFRWRWRCLWFAADDVLALTKSDNVVTVTIQDSDTLEDVAQNLKDHGLVRYKFLFTSTASSAMRRRSSAPVPLN